MLERTRFNRCEVSGRTLHKWLARPLRSPQRTRDDLVNAIVVFRKRFPFMGPRKIIVRLTELHPEIEWPAPSTVGDILARRSDLKVLPMSPV